MRRLVVLVSALAILAMPAVSFAIQGTEKPKPKSVTASGEATVVATDSFTVKGKTGEWKFTIDKNTVVTGGGASAQEPCAQGRWQGARAHRVRQSRRRRHRDLRRQRGR